MSRSWPKVAGQAEPGVRRQRPAPAGALGDAPQHVRPADARRRRRSGADPALLPRPVEQRQAEGQRVLTDLMGRLVHEGFERPSWSSPVPTARSQPGRKLFWARSLLIARTRWAPTSYQWSAPRSRTDRRRRRSSPWAGRTAPSPSVGQPAHGGVIHGDRRVPPASNAIRSVCTDGERMESKRQSSARVSTIFTGLPLSALDGQRRGHAVVAVQPPPEAAAQQVGPHDDLLRRHRSALASTGRTSDCHWLPVWISNTPSFSKASALTGSSWKCSTPAVV